MWAASIGKMECHEYLSAIYSLQLDTIKRLFENHRVTLTLVSPLFVFFLVTADDKLPPPPSLSEKILLERLQETSPAIQSIRAQRADRELERSLLRERFESTLSPSISYLNTKERAISALEPVISPQLQSALRISRRLPFGVEIIGEAQARQISVEASQVYDATQVRGLVRAQFDLWNNLFGIADRALLSALVASEKGAELRETLQRKSLESDIRILYWRWLATNERLRVSKELLRGSDVQLTDARQRRRQSAADEGDVALLEAQWLQRQRDLDFLTQQKVGLLTTIEELLGPLPVEWKAADPLDLGSLLRERVADAQSCAANPSNEWLRSDWDDVVALLQTERDGRTRSAQYSHLPTVQGFAQLQTSGARSSLGGAFDDWRDDTKLGYEVGVQLSLPLEGDRFTSRRKMMESNHLRLDAESQRLQYQLNSKRSQWSQTLPLLYRQLEAQQKSSLALEKAVRSKKRKFDQARASINDLIHDQNAYYQSRLQEISLQEEILVTVLDFKKTLTKLSCLEL